MSPDGKREIAVYYIVPGSIFDEYLVVNVAPRDEPYAPDASVASFSKATDLRAFWTANGRPVLVAKTMEGSFFDHIPELIICVGPEKHFTALRAEGQAIAVRAYETGGRPPS